MTGQQNYLHYIHLQMLLHQSFGCHNQFQSKFYIMCRVLSQDILFQCKVRQLQAEL